MTRLSRFDTGEVSPRKQAMRQDVLAFCDRGFTRSDLAESLDVSLRTINKWLAPSEDEMPEAYEDRWTKAVGSIAILTAGVELTDPYDLLMRDLLDTMVQHEARRAAC